MPSWPADWQHKTLDAMGAQVTGQALTAIRAWKNSTPLPPLSNNPLGMPAGSSGAPSYLGTGYAIFPSMSAFYSAVSAWARSQAGKTVAGALNDSGGYPAAWRAISSLKWPASATETDYPSALLDLTADSYRESVAATPSAARKTSGTVGGESTSRPSLAAQQAAISTAVSSAKTAMDAARIAVAKGKIYNGRLCHHIAGTRHGNERRIHGVHPGMEDHVPGNGRTRGEHQRSGVRHRRPAQRRRGEIYHRGEDKRP